MALSIYRGEKKVWTCTATDASAALDLTGATIKFAVREGYPASSIADDTTAKITKTTASGIVVTNATGGIFTLTLLAADTASLEAGYYVYGVEMTNAGGGPYVLDQGTFTITSDVVRA